MLEFLDDIEPMEPSWQSWARAHEPAPIWLASVALSDRTAHIVGCFVTPAESVLGLRPWDDADEGADPAPWVIFDIEKLVRMALHQSGLAFEALCSPRAWGNLAARPIAAAAVTRDVLSYYVDVTAPLREGHGDAWRWRTLLTGVLLAREGRVSHSLPTLCDRLSAPPTPEEVLVTELRAELQASRSLPDRPSDYDYLNDLVVSARLSTR